MRDILASPATTQDGAYPRPQLVRPAWYDLSGPWEFAYDDGDEGLAAGWATTGTEFPHTDTIRVPFPPESPASGIGDAGYHRVLWYRRSITADETAATRHTTGRRLLMHFGAVDYRADVWIDGRHLIRHEGGHTPFTVEAPADASAFVIVVRVEDDPHDLAQPRGKQDWELHPHAVWYHRTSGIWQPVWLESVPQRHLSRITWRPDLSSGEVHLEIELDAAPLPGTRVRATLSHASTPLAEISAVVSTERAHLCLPIERLRNGQAIDELLWSPERPTLIDASVRLDAPGQEPDLTTSYLGLRSVGIDDGRFLLNERPYPVRGVLSQGYWPESHLAAPDPGALRSEVELIKELGFTTVRVHQKIEDPRFLYWADRLGLLVWEEMPSVYEFSDTASARLLAEWTAAVRRDIGHPSIVAWVPFNESWGVQHVASDARQRDLVRAVYHLTKSIDDSRPVISNDGWEHVRSDLLTVHDYENESERLVTAYGDAQRLRESLRGVAPSGRRTFVGTPEETTWTEAAPAILSEFGGVSVDPAGNGHWGYRHVDSIAALRTHLMGLFAAVQGSEVLAGWCYTQLTDTGQETNGLSDEHRRPKLPAPLIRAIVQGTPLSDSLPVTSLLPRELRHDNPPSRPQGDEISAV